MVALADDVWGYFEGPRLLSGQVFRPGRRHMGCLKRWPIPLGLLRRSPPRGRQTENWRPTNRVLKEVYLDLCRAAARRTHCRTVQLGSGNRTRLPAEAARLVRPGGQTKVFKEGYPDLRSAAARRNQAPHCRPHQHGAGDRCRTPAEATRQARSGGPYQVFSQVGLTWDLSLHWRPASGVASTGPAARATSWPRPSALDACGGHTKCLAWPPR